MKPANQQGSMATQNWFQRRLVALFLTLISLFWKKEKILIYPLDIKSRRLNPKSFTVGLRAP